MKITGKTKVYGIFGNPVEHSFSPVIQNTAFEKNKYSAVYVPFLVTDLKQAMQGARNMAIQGLSITIPFKISILPLLDEIDPLAQNIGAVNTVVNKNGKMIGYNTDGRGALKALQETEKNLAGKKITMLGCGGAARAIGFTLAQENPESLSILVRPTDCEPGQSLAHEITLKTGVKTLSGVIGTDFPDCDILINTTPVGMHPKADESPIDKRNISSGITVFDIIYNPKETFLLKVAQNKGCKVVYGYKMLLYQGVEQFKLWTGQQPPVKEMEQALLECLQ